MIILIIYCIVILDKHFWRASTKLSSSHLIVISPPFGLIYRKAQDFYLGYVLTCETLDWEQKVAFGLFFVSLKTQSLNWGFPLKQETIASFSVTLSFHCSFPQTILPSFRLLGRDLGVFALDDPRIRKCESAHECLLIA